MTTHPIPAAYRTPMPYLIVNDAAKAIAFYVEAFGATELIRLADPSGKVMHAEIRIGGAPLMLADEFPAGYQSFGARRSCVRPALRREWTAVQGRDAAGAKETAP
jgi:PhnB protein